MSNLLILNQSEYHSDWASFFYLGPDSSVSVLHVYTDDRGGCYILGGPALTKDEFGLTDAALRLISCLDAGFYFFPKSSQDIIREAVQENQDQIDDSSAILNSDWGHEKISAYSNRYSVTECCDFLLSDMAPESAIVFIHRYQKGDVLLATELTRIYYALSKEQREELGLYADWIHVLG